MEKYFFLKYFYTYSIHAFCVLLCDMCDMVCQVPVACGVSVTTALSKQMSHSSHSLEYATIGRRRRRRGRGGRGDSKLLVSRKTVKNTKGVHVCLISTKWHYEIHVRTDMTSNAGLLPAKTPAG